MEMVITPEAFAQLRAENEQLKARYDALQFELSQLKRLLFGTRRERLVLPPPNQGSLDLDGDVPADSTPPEVATVTRTVTVPVRRHPHRDEIPAHLSRVVEVLDLSEAEKPCPCCGEARQVLGELISEKLDYVPATLQVLQTRRPQYVCHACAQIDVAPLPPAPIEQGLAAPGLLAQVATAKLIDHIPVERQCRILAREGVRLSPNTVLDWFPAMGQLLKPLFQALLQVIFTSDILHSDDTILPLKDTGPGRKPGKLRQARLWTWHSGLHPLVAYQFTRDRSGSHVRDWLQAWSGGYLVADAYSGYDALFAERPDIIEVGCWAHLRRKFYEVAVSAKVSGLAQEAVLAIDQLFRWEREWKELGPPERLERRRQHSRDHVLAFERWLRTHHPTLLPQSPLAKACRYALNQWEAFTRFLEDGRLPLSNNAAERDMRPVAMGRRNFFYVGSVRSGEAIAILLSLLRSAILCGLNPRDYLKDVLTRMPSAKAADLSDLLPHRWQPA